MNARAETYLSRVSNWAYSGPLKASVVAGAVLALCAVPVAAQAGGAISVSKPWFRAVAGPAPAAGYFTLLNTSTKPVVLVGLSSPACGTLVMHQSRNINGVDSMTMVAQRVVPAHGQAVFAPGGYHLMCMSPSRMMRPGRSIPVTLRFASGHQLVARFPVRPLGG